ncbi:cytolysin immunity CylI protein [Oceanobacillus picturae]|uniref:Cytolysin immunity CylI protein n=1 Tax=Oceanobacillus picturae TaxID=171693 RepID=A0A0U9H4F9_9BACI|nr:hypothetical protein [Oceanobacillus picturae]GAQ17578.1 cytolysin immunity CylI protein [Oceanobacillus picturae]
MLYVIGLPLTTLIHETGHALAFICFTKEGVAKVHLRDFSDANKENFRVGRIHYHIKWGMVGICYYEKPSGMTAQQRAMTSLGGPLLSVSFTIILFFLFYYQPFNDDINFFVTGMFWMNLVQFIVTIIPMVYPKWWGSYAGYTSDGYKALKFLQRDK